MKRLYECRTCQGQGVLNDYVFSVEVEVCPSCEGTGQVVATPLEARVFLGEPQEDPKHSRATRRKLRSDPGGAK